MRARAGRTLRACGHEVQPTRSTCAQPPQRGRRRRPSPRRLAPSRLPARLLRRAGRPRARRAPPMERRSQRLGDGIALVARSANGERQLQAERGEIVGRIVAREPIGVDEPVDVARRGAASAASAVSRRVSGSASGRSSRDVVCGARSVAARRRAACELFDKARPSLAPRPGRAQTASAPRARARRPRLRARRNGADRRRSPARRPGARAPRRHSATARAPCAAGRRSSESMAMT